jgi:hypothetical protein
MTIEALIDRPAILAIVDATGKRHVMSVHEIRQATPAGPGTTFLATKHGGDLFVLVPVEQVKAAMALARRLRRAQKATWERAQLALDFGDST